MTRPQPRTASAPPPPLAPHPNGEAHQPGADHQPGAEHQPGPNRYHTLLGAARQRADRAAQARRRRRTITRRLVWVPILLLSTAIAIGVALRVTPQQTVTVAGQVIKVGTTAPSLSVSGPGEVNVFGQSLATQVQFLGPVRPSLTLTQITINSQLTNFVQGAGPAGAERILGNALASGWIHYFLWEIAITAAGALLLLGALAGWRRLPHRTTLKLLAGGLAATEAINLGAIMLTAYTAPGTLRQVSSLSQLVGSEPEYPGSQRAAPALPGVRVVVMGDSTAAGAGLPWVRDASHTDQMCGRSADSYAEDLARSNGWPVMNLACNSATISQGLLGPEGRGGELVPAQIDAAQQATKAQAVIVSVGADDLDWAAMLRLCAVAKTCNDKATTAYFQQQLATFSKDYFQLLTRLANLPSHPQVIINRYYNPFDLQLSCLSKVGLTPVKLRTLNSRLVTLNAVLAKGAAEFGFTSVKPDFAGHQLCTAQPYVQGLGDLAPFHPTADGQLAIALADQAALSPAIMPSSAAVQTPSPAATPPR